MTNGNALPGVIVGRGLREKTVVSVGKWGWGSGRMVTDVKGRGSQKVEGEGGSD